MQRALIGLIAAAAGALGACNLDVTNPNSPSTAGALDNPRASAAREIAGVFATYRDNRADQVRDLGSYGRETYYMFITDGRWITGPYRDWKKNNAFTAGSQWAGRYNNYRNAYEALKLVNATADAVITPGEKAGASGALKTFIALEMLHVIEARGTIGAVVDMTDDVNAVLPIVSEDSVYKWISAKLDEAKADLDTPGASFYFPMHSGFSAFGVPANTPAGFGQFNRALKARVEAKRGSLGCGVPCYTTALTALGGTWIADLTRANRDNGVYVIYSTASGDLLNTASFGGNADIYVHPLIDSIAGVGLDDRYRRKVDTQEVGGAENDACTAVYSARTEVGVTGTNRPCTYATNVTPIPIIRNEELVLIRAEARWFAGDAVGATADLALVRDSSGATRGGTAVFKSAAPANDAQFVDELLLQRTLSLFQEGQRWVDHRRFGRLAELGTLAQDVASSFTVGSYSVLPSQECDARARAGNPGGIALSCPGNQP